MKITNHLRIIAKEHQKNSFYSNKKLLVRKDVISVNKQITMNTAVRLSKQLISMRKLAGK